MANPSGQIICYAIVGGVLPTLLWLKFWLSEDKEQPEPKGLIALCFILGAVMVMPAIAIEKIMSGAISSHRDQIIIWATIEEFFKYIAVAVVAFGSQYLDEPIDYPMYLIAGALGFAAFENTIFLIKPLMTGDMTVSLFTGNLRFLGSTLLHAISSGAIGIFLGLSFWNGWATRKFALLIGFISAITLHSLFNLFIMNGTSTDIWNTLGFLWVTSIVSILIFEKLKRMKTRTS